MTLETLDHRDADPTVARATLADLAVSNTLFGGRQAARWGVERLLKDAPTRTGVTLLDVGAGAGDIARHLVRTLGVAAIALDHLACAARLCRDRGFDAVVADLHHLPLAPRSVDVVLVSQVLHHLPRPAVPAFLRAMTAVARLGVVVADLRRSPMARAGIWTAAHVLRFHRVTRLDGVTSVRRGFARAELDALCRRAGVVPMVRRRPGWRLVAWWRA